MPVSLGKAAFIVYDISLLHLDYSGLKMTKLDRDLGEGSVCCSNPI